MCFYTANIHLQSQKAVGVKSRAVFCQRQFHRSHNQQVLIQAEMFYQADYPVVKRPKKKKKPSVHLRREDREHPSLHTEGVKSKPVANERRESLSATGVMR